MSDPISADLAAVLRDLGKAGKIASDWLPGMLVDFIPRQREAHPMSASFYPRRITSRSDITRFTGQQDGEVVVGPVVDDPATMGCLLALVREAFGDNTIHLSPATYDRYDDGEPEIRWHVNRHHEGEDEWMRESGAFGEMADGHRDPPIVGATEADALLAALRAALPTEPHHD